MMSCEFQYHWISTAASWVLYKLCRPSNSFSAIFYHWWAYMFESQAKTKQSWQGLPLNIPLTHFQPVWSLIFHRRGSAQRRTRVALGGQTTRNFRSILYNSLPQVFLGLSFGWKPFNTRWCKLSPNYKSKQLVPHWLTSVNLQTIK